MKKYVLAVLVSLGLVGCSSSTKSTNVSSDKLVGTWICVTEYDDLEIETQDLITLKSDGTMTDEGNTIYPIKHRIFNYETKSKGTWSLNNDQLTYKLTMQGDVKRLHASGKAFKALQKEARFVNLKKMEKGLFDILSERKGREDSIDLFVKKIDGEHFISEQRMDHKTYLSVCLRRK